MYCSLQQVLIKNLLSRSIIQAPHQELSVLHLLEIQAPDKATQVGDKMLQIGLRTYADK